MLGRVIRQNVCRELAPRLRAACSWSSPISWSTGTTSRMTSGRATNVVAMIRPGVWKMTGKFAESSNVGPNQPSRPL